MDCFFAAVEVKDNPDLAGKPVIVGALPGTRGVVAACSYEARAFGIHSAMPISQAYKKCPQGIYLKPRGHRYSEESEKIFHIFHVYTPLVEPMSLDEAFLDVSGSHLLFGTSVDIGHAIKQQIHDDLGLIASIGIAPTKFVAKIASDLEKPDGFVVVNEEEVMDFLAPLDARKILGVGKATWRILDKLGLKTIGDIRMYPVEELERIFGKYGRHLHNLSYGRDDSSVLPESEQKQVSNEHTFPVDTNDSLEIERMLLHLSDKVASRLLESNLRGYTVTLKLRDENFTTVTRSRSFTNPLFSTEDIYREVRDLFHGENISGRKVRLIGVGVSNFVSIPQMSLFDGTVVKKEKIEKAIDNIRERFGKGAITRATLIGKQRKKRSKSGENE